MSSSTKKNRKACVAALEGLVDKRGGRVDGATIMRLLDKECKQCIETEGGLKSFSLKYLADSVGSIRFVTSKLGDTFMERSYHVSHDSHGAVALPPTATNFADDLMEMPLVVQNLRKALVKARQKQPETFDKEISFSDLRRLMDLCGARFDVRGLAGMAKELGTDPSPAFIVRKYCADIVTLTGSGKAKKATNNGPADAYMAIASLVEKHGGRCDGGKIHELKEEHRQVIREAGGLKVFFEKHGPIDGCVELAVGPKTAILQKRNKEVSKPADTYMAIASVVEKHGGRCDGGKIHELKEEHRHVIREAGGLKAFFEKHCPPQGDVELAIGPKTAMLQKRNKEVSKDAKQTKAMDVPNLLEHKGSLQVESVTGDPITVEAADRWMNFLKEHPELQRAERSTMQDAYRQMQAKLNLKSTGAASFSTVGNFLRASGREEYGTWSDFASGKLAAYVLASSSEALAEDCQAGISLDLSEEDPTATLRSEENVAGKDIGAKNSPNNSGVDPWFSGRDPWGGAEQAAFTAELEVHAKLRPDATPSVQQAHPPVSDPWHTSEGDPWRNCKESEPEECKGVDPTLTSIDSSTDCEGDFATFRKPLPVAQQAVVSRSDQNPWQGWQQSSHTWSSRSRSQPISAQRRRTTPFAEQDCFLAPSLCRSYALADFVKFHKRKNVFYPKILAAYPDSLVAAYIQAGGKGDDISDEGGADFTTLNRVTPTHPAPASDTLVIHMRTGDVCDKKGHSPPGLLSARHFLSCTVNAYTKPLRFFHQIAMYAHERAVSNIDIITGQLVPGSVSAEYVEQVAMFFRTGVPPYDDLDLRRLPFCWPKTRVWDAQHHRDWGEVDKHFAYGCNATLFATTGGGFGELMAAMVKLRGGKLLNPQYKIPVRPHNASQPRPDCNSAWQESEKCDNPDGVGTAIDLEQLLAWLPLECHASLIQEIASEESEGGCTSLAKLTVDIGSHARAWFRGGWKTISNVCISEDNVHRMVDGLVHSHITGRVKLHGIPNTLHRVAALHAPTGDICGLTVHVKHDGIGASTMIQSLLDKNCSILILGAAKSGKTTLLRDVARIFSTNVEDDVLVADPCGEMGGLGSKVHRALGMARRTGWPRGPEADSNLLETLMQEHSPKTIVLDEPDRLLNAAELKRLPHWSNSLKFVCSMQGSLEDLATDSRLGVKLEDIFAAAVVLPGAGFKNCRLVHNLHAAVSQIREGNPYEYDTSTCKEL